MYLIFTPYIIGDDIKYGRSPNSDTYLKSVPWASSVFFRPTRIDDVNLIKIRTLHLLNFFWLGLYVSGQEKKMSKCVYIILISLDDATLKENIAK